MRITESIIRNLNESEKDNTLINLMKQYWDELETNKEQTNKVKTHEWFKQKGYDLTYDEIDNIWDKAAEDFPQDEDEPLVIDGQNFTTISDAKSWLDDKLSVYGNTYHFPPHERNILNQLIEKFGNTYFWK